MKCKGVRREFGEKKNISKKTKEKDIKNARVKVKESKEKEDKR